MADNCLNIWQKAQNIIINKVNKGTYETWLKLAKPVSLQGNTMIFKVPNKFTKDWLSSKYASIIKEAIFESSGNHYHIEFIISEASPDNNNFNDIQLDDNNKDFFSNKDIDINKSSVSASSCNAWLNPKYTFSSFVIGGSNRFAHAASLAVAEAPSKAYNPLFIYGGVGLGKTHLMHAIGHYALESNYNARVVYTSSETFTNDFINSIRENKTVEFRNKYRNIDILLVDDIQFLAKKEQTQEEFFHTFNALHENNKQIVISSDRTPKEIPTLEERLISRFEWGLITDIQSPDLETRIAILKNKAAKENISVPNEVIIYIADKINTNIRELEGAFIRVIAYSSLSEKKINVDLASEALSYMISQEAIKEVTIEEIQKETADQFGIKLADIKGKKRTRNIATARQVAMFLSREMTTYSLPKIGDEFGGKDHTTVIHAYNKIEKNIISDPSLKKIIDSITEILTNNPS